MSRTRVGITCLALLSLRVAGAQPVSPHQADLIRNFVLMRLDESSQTQLYEEHWQPIEQAFGRRYRTEFDKFVKDFLTLQMRPGTPLKAAGAGIRMMLMESKLIRGRKMGVPSVTRRR